MLTKSKIFAFSIVALLALNGCGDRGADIGGSGAGGGGGGGGSGDKTCSGLYPLNPDGSALDSDADGIPDYLEDINCNGKTDPGETDKDNPDTDGDGLKDGDPEEKKPSLIDPTVLKSLKSCEPAQPAGYRGYDYTNKMWVIPDCDGDGYKNGTEDNKSLDPHYISDPYSANSACFVFHTKEYCEIHTKDGKTWLDRNLGADKNCSKPDDKKCYGDYYQWGRTADGHEKVKSDKKQQNPEYSDYNSITGKVAAPFESKYFEKAAGDTHDWLLDDGANYDEGKPAPMDTREKYWKTVFANNTDGVCPKDFRVPTSDEVNDVMVKEGNIQTVDQAFASPLLMGSAGYKNRNGLLAGTGGEIRISTTTYGIRNSSSQAVTLNDTRRTNSDENLVNGMPIRCIKK